MNPSGGSRNGIRSLEIAVVLWLSAFMIYQTTFLCTPRLFLFERTAFIPADSMEWAAGLRGRPNELDMRKHLLYAPVGRALFRFANGVRLRIGISHDTVALVFPEALCGAASVVLAYFIFLRFMQKEGWAAASAALYAFTYSVWLFGSVTESYALTTLSVNLFLYFALPSSVKPNRRWYLAMITLVTFSSMCDLRSLLLLIVPLYVIAGMRVVKRAQRIKTTILIVVLTLCLVAAAYQIYGNISGYRSFSIYSMCKWLPSYGQSYTSIDHILNIRTAIRTLLTLFIEAVSPFYQAHISYGSAATRGVHHFLGYGFAALYTVLVLISIRSIGRRLRASVSLQGLACWLIVYTIYHIFYAPQSALVFSRPLIFPLLLIVLPGLISFWSQWKTGMVLMLLAAVFMLANNLIVINEARVAWQRPDIVLKPADGIFLLPGEMERLGFLTRKGVSLLSAGERRRLAELEAKPADSLTEGEGHEMIRLLNRALVYLPGSENAEARDIAFRFNAAVQLSLEENQRGINR